MTYANERPPQRDRYILIPVFILAPLGLIWGIVIPAQKKIAAMQARIDEANQKLAVINHVTPLTAEERQVLEDPKAAWRSRMPMLQSDLGKLQHYTRVVTGLQDRFRVAGATVEGVRSSWDPIHADFTSPGPLPFAGIKEATAPSPDATVAGWALEVQIASPPRSLGLALSAVPKIDSILIPAGLRWEARDGKPFQSLILRNLYLTPAPPPPPPSTP